MTDFGDRVEHHGGSNAPTGASDGPDEGGGNKLNLSELNSLGETGGHVEASVRRDAPSTGHQGSIRVQASGAIVDQFLVAGGSVVIQVIAARTLGTSGFGAFALYNATLTLLTAIQTGWVGDSLTVLDRFDRGIRSALIGSQLMFVVVCFGLATAASLALGLASLSGALWFGLMVALWISEEVGRRIFMARLEFWQLIVNDGVDVVVSLLALPVLRYTFGYLDLDMFVVAMAIGAAAATLVAFVQLPRHEWRPTRFTRSGVREVVDFASWRSAQTGIRPLAMLLMRILIATLVSTAALGAVEAARLIVAPAITFVAGAGSFLLPLYAEDERGRRRHSISLSTAMALLVAAVVAYGVFAVAFTGPLSHLLSAGKFAISRVAVSGWTVFAIGFAAGLPPTFALVARKAASRVFWIRVFDSAIGLTAVVVLLEVTAPGWAPWGLAAGMFVGTFWLSLDARRTSRRPQVISSGEGPARTDHDDADPPSVPGDGGAAEVPVPAERTAADRWLDEGAPADGTATVRDATDGTWEWTGTQWQKQPPAASPRGQDGSGLMPEIEA